jgi:uncharacterized protein YkwD
MSTIIRRVALLALVGALLLPAAPPVAAADTTPMAEAEQQVVALLNQQRAEVGLLPLQVDIRLRTIARARATDMAVKGYFAHQQPDGRWAWDLMTEAGITWYGAGEILAANGWGELSESATGAAQQWRDSSSHYAIVTGRDYNYFGVGLAVDAAGKKIWATIFLKGPDRTGALAKLTTPSTATAISAGAAAQPSVKRSVTISWTGADPPLQVLTAGLRDYRLQTRYAGDSTWITLNAATTSTSIARGLWVGRVYEFRVRARDNAGNYGAWSAPITIVP